MRITKILLSICVLHLMPIGSLQSAREDEDFEIVINEEEHYIIFKNEVSRKGVIKEEEFVDISAIRDVEKRLHENQEELDSLLKFEKTSKGAVSLNCPNFEMNSESHLDDINDDKFSELNGHLPVRIAHGEHTGKDGSLHFLVTMEKKQGTTFCFFEYSVYQRNHIQDSAIDTKLPYTYQEMEVYFELQSSSMINIETWQKCAARGVVVSNEEDTRIVNMTHSQKITDQIIGRASCARLCMSEDYKFNFLLKNNEQTKEDWPCKWWAYTPEVNMCYLYKGDMPKISQDYRRAGSVYGSETYKDYNSVYGPVKCIDRVDTHNPYLLVNSEVVNVHEICTYKHQGVSGMQDIILNQCYKEYQYRHNELLEQKQAFEEIHKMLRTTTVSRPKRAATAVLPFLIQLPSLFSWISEIVKGTKDTPKMMRANKAPPYIFDRMTLDKTIMFKGLIKGLMETYGSKYVQRVHTKTSSKEAGTMEVPENWFVKENNFDIELLRNNSHSISFSNKMTNRVRKNWLWNARNSQDKKELVELHTTIRNAREDERPMSQKLKTKIDGNDYVFLSLVENYVIKRLYMMAQQVDEFPETQYLLLATSKLSNFSEGHHISNANSDLKTLHCLAKNAEKVMPKSCQKVMHEQLQDYSEYDLYSKEYSRIVARVFVEDDNIIQIDCLHTSDVLVVKGVAFLYMDRSCTIRRNGKILTNGQMIDPEEVFGFKVIYNAPSNMHEVSNPEGEKSMTLETMHEVSNPEGEKSMTLETIYKIIGKLKKQLEILEASSYEGGIEMYIDIILVIVVALIVVWLFVYRTLKKFCEQRS